ncbi:hypothetical protein [Streptomyces sp. NPDC004675]|uniref:hypothetical protein n=1 Tax=Streptomyces sp. NPDC004675 TaxID=3154286 RepID=UPI0033BE000C
MAAPGPVRPDRRPRPQPLLVGTLAAYLQRQDLDADLLRRYLQSPDPDRYITREAVQHLDGLTGAVPEDSPEPAWMAVGRHIARDGRFS